MVQIEIEPLKKIFKSVPEIKLVYLFGSRAHGDIGPQSDYDFAVYLALRDKHRMSDIRFKLLAQISRELKTDDIDLVILNLTEGPELKYNIIKDGRIIYEEEPYKIVFEPLVLNEYFDFKALLQRHGLTRA
ncbi:MAG: nucleotidyltransferase domain-containing protein [Deltaproteobacteria bacterium]|nr:nucleotidyltransferase domain-containing protein [Deltaproteobacteria bacterium]